MKRFALTIIVAAGMAAIVPAAQGAPNGTATGTFDVNLTLTSKCEVNNTDAGPFVGTAIAMNYTSFQTTPASGNTSFNVKCTDTLPFGLSLDTASHLDATTNLTYTLSLPVSSGVGDGANHAFTVNAGITAGQAGTCALGSCDNSAGVDKTRTLTVTY